MRKILEEIGSVSHPLVLVGHAANFMWNFQRLVSMTLGSLKALGLVAPGVCPN